MNKIKNDRFDGTINNIITETKQRVTEKIKRHEELRKSKDYLNQINRLNAITLDFILALKISSIFSTRFTNFNDNSICIFAIQDLLETSLMIQTIVKEGAINPTKRELRYILELAIKGLYVDQKMWQEPLSKKLSFWEKNLKKASITPEIYHINFYLFEASEEVTNIIEDIKKAYGRACNYVHPTVHQIKERIELAEQGITIGLETAKELKEIVDEIFTVYSFVLVYFFHGLGHTTAGELFKGVWNKKPNWSFHWNKYIIEIDKYFDYKHERQKRLEQIKLNRQKRLTETINQNKNQL